MVTERRPIRLLVVCAINGYGGPVQSISSVLRQLGSKVASIAATQPEVRAANRPNGASVSPLHDVVTGYIPVSRPQGRGLLLAMWSLSKRARRLRRSVDVIHANGLTEATMVLPLSLLARLPVVVWIHNYEQPRAFRWVRPLMKIFGRRWTWLAVSPTARQLVPARWPVDVVPNPIEHQAGPAEPRLTGTVLVGYLAGTDHPVKGFDLLPDIVRAVPEDTTSFLIVAAESRVSDHPAAKAAWLELRGALASRVVLHDHVGDIVPLLHQCDIVLVPSRKESFNRVLAESMASGVPVVASDLPAHTDHFAYGDIGVLFKAGDSADAARAIRRLAGDPTSRARYSTRARATALGYESSHVAEVMLQHWSSATLGRRRCIWARPTR